MHKYVKDMHIGHTLEVTHRYGKVTISAPLIAYGAESRKNTESVRNNRL
jgi:hypothetical protein